MDRVNRFFELKELWKQSAEADRPAIDRQITELMNGMADQEIEELAIGVQRILTIFIRNLPISGNSLRFGSVWNRYCLICQFPSCQRIISINHLLGSINV